MTEEHRKKIAELSERNHRAKLKFDCLGMANTYGLGEDARLKLQIDYDLARAEMFEAMHDLETAVLVHR